MKADLTSVEVLGLAIRGEEEAAELYDQMAKMIKNKLARSKYEALAKEESRHKEMLLGLYRRATGEKEAPRVPGGHRTAEGGFPVPLESMEDLLRLAICRQQEAQEFYRRAANQSTDHAARRMLEYLADIEHGHELMLESELAAYLRDRDWYANNPDVQLVGP
jgi:rubrerythrin